MTPPQSAPPQKTPHHSFFMDRQRSKSPGDARPISTAAVGNNPVAASAISNSLLAIEGSSGVSNAPKLLRPFPRRGGEKTNRRSIEDWEIPYHKVEFKDQIGK